MTTKRQIVKVDVPQEIIRKPFTFRAAGEFLKLIRNQSKPVLYFAESQGPVESFELQACLTQDCIDWSVWNYVDTLRIWGLTLHFFIREIEQ